MTNKAGTAPLIEAPLMKNAVAFGWSKIGESFRLYALVYLALALTGVALADWAPPVYGFKTDTLAATIMFFPALATATRFAIPTFRMDARTFASIFLIWLLTTAPSFAAAMVSPSSLGKFEWVLIPILLLGIWISIKVVLAPAFFALHAHEGRDVIAALVASWRTASGKNWWRVLGLFVAIGLACYLVPSLASFGILRWGQAHNVNPVIGIGLSAAVSYVGSISGTIWTQLSLVAFASSFVDRARPAAGR